MKGDYDFKDDMLHVLHLKQRARESLLIPENADIRQIRRVYRKQVKRFHPDLHPGDAADSRMFLVITQAYAVLAKDYRPDASNTLLWDAPSVPAEPVDEEYISWWIRQYRDLF